MLLQSISFLAREDSKDARNRFANLLTTNEGNGVSKNISEEVNLLEQLYRRVSRCESTTEKTTSTRYLNQFLHARRLILSALHVPLSLRKLTSAHVVDPNASEVRIAKHTVFGTSTADPEESRWVSATLAQISPYTNVSFSIRRQPARIIDALETHMPIAMKRNRASHGKYLDHMYVHFGKLGCHPPSNFSYAQLNELDTKILLKLHTVHYKKKPEQWESAAFLTNSEPFLAESTKSFPSPQ